MLITIEISRPFQPKPGGFKSEFKDKINYRFWWLWFAISWINMSEPEYSNYIASGKTEWTSK